MFGFRQVLRKKQLACPQYEDGHSPALALVPPGTPLPGPPSRDHLPGTPLPRPHLCLAVDRCRHHQTLGRKQLACSRLDFAIARLDFFITRKLPSRREPLLARDPPPRTTLIDARPFGRQNVLYLACPPATLSITRFPCKSCWAECIAAAARCEEIFRLICVVRYEGRR